jgi:hypothetical protein
MRSAVSRRRQSQRVPIKRIFFIFLFVSIFILLLVTCLYSFPVIFAYLSSKGLISPLASTVGIHDALGNSMTQDTVKQKVEKAHFPVKTIEEFDESYSVTLVSGETILFSKKKSLEQQISSLQLISSRLTIEGKHFISLDLRFDRPVLVPK